jgi:hypothetical protein
MNHRVHSRLSRMTPWSAALLVPMVLAGCSQSGAATPDAKPAGKTPPATQPAVKQTAAKQSMAGQAATIQPTAAKPAATQPTAKRPTTGQVFGKGSWYVSNNTTGANWSKTGLFYETPWEDHVDAGDNTTLELYVKALTPHTIEVFNARKLGIGMLARPDATHPKASCDLNLGNYVQLKDQNWTKVSIPLADFKDVNPHDVYFFPCLPQAFGTGDYSLGVDEIRFVGGSAPVVFYGDAHPNNPIALHGPGMEAHFVATGGVDVEATVPGK